MTTLATIIALFNILVGVMLTTSIVMMVAGLMVWYVRLGTYPTYRDQAISMMQWGVAILFVLVVLLGVAQFVQTHMSLSMLLIGAVVAAAIAYFVITTMVSAGGKEEEHE